MDKKRVVFKDTADKQLEDRVQEIVNKKITEREDQEKKKSVQDKLDAIKKTLIPQAIPKVSEEHVHSHVEDGNDCPTCASKGNKHTIKIVGRVAKCTGPECGTEYLLEQRPKTFDKSNRKNLLCTTCGHSMTEEEIKGQDTCPLCNLGKGVMKVDWSEYDTGKLAKTRVL